MQHSCTLACVLILGISVTATHAAGLPQAVATHIEQQLPDYHWVENARHIVVGDLDANNLDDIALLLSNPEDWQLTVYRQLDNERYQAHVIDQFPGNDQAFKQSFMLQDLKLALIEQGSELNIQGTAINGTAENTASLVLQLPAAEKMVMLFQWNTEQQLFGTSRLRLTAASDASSCAYDPASGAPNPLGMRALITIEEREGNTVFIYEQFPSTLSGTIAATIAVRRELIFHQTSMNTARALMREQPSYYQTLTGDDDPAGFAAVDATMVCH